MAATFINPDARAVQPDPILTNLVQDSSNQGDWFAPVGCSVKQSAKDYVRWAKRNSQSLLNNLAETLRAPGARYNLIPRPDISWVTSSVLEDALRVEFTEEDIANAMSPDEPFNGAAMKILNGLQFATELRVKTLFAAAAHTAGASSAWSGDAGSIMADVEKAKLAVLLNSGLPANGILIDPAKAPGAFASTELKSLQIYQPNQLLTQGAFTPTLFGLRVFIPGSRIDSAPTGTFTPAFVWDTAEAYVFYSPTLAGGAWSGDGQAFSVQFENQLNGAAYEIKRRLDADYEENLKHIVFGNVRRSLPELMNTDTLFRITGI
jgi:hypothetical protein